MLWPYEVLNCTRPAPALCFLSETVMWCFSAFLDCFALELTTLLMVFCLFPILSFVYVSFNPRVTSSILCLVVIAVLCVPWPVFHDMILAGFDFCSLADILMI